MSHPLIEIADENKEKFFALFDQSGGKVDYTIEQGEKNEFLEVKVLNEEAKLAGIVWYFGPQRAYIEDIRTMVTRIENQKVPMVLLAAEGTTSQGKKELKPHKIRIVKDFESIEVKTKKKSKKKKKVEEKVEVSIEDDISLTKLPDNPLMRIVRRLLQRREPEIVQMKQVDDTDETTFEVRAYSSDKTLLAVYRTVDKDSIGVSTVRDFIEKIEDEQLDGVPVALIGKVKFTPTSKKEALEKNINLISLSDEKEAKGDEEQQKLNERLRQGAIEIIKQRGYEIVTKTGPLFSKLVAGSESLGTYLVAENHEKKSLLVLLPSEEVVRVATVREFSEQIESLGIDDGMLIALKRFTYTAEREAKEFGISALRKNHPVFNIFSHYLVPEHEIMDKLDVDVMLERYNASLMQLPRIYEDDPGVVAVNGKVGDVVRIIRDQGENYRLVVPRPEGGSTENTALVQMTDKRRKRLAEAN
ncbi:MAG: DNA-directed RNA polymerase subunit RpoH/Rpb5 C-terminal domain-containing protein [Candidatus Kariarchaeaceae archaeon]|jgi:DNA-directed RNA polymerase subunit H